LSQCQQESGDAVSRDSEYSSLEGDIVTAWLDSMCT